MLGHVFDHPIGILAKQWVVLQIKKLWWLSSNMVMSWKDVKARRISTSVILRFQFAEDAGIVATDKEDFVALKVEVDVNGIYQHLRWGDKDIEGIFEQGDNGFNSISMTGYEEPFGYDGDPCVGRM